MAITITAILIWGTAAFGYYFANLIVVDGVSLLYFSSF